VSTKTSPSPSPSPSPSKGGRFHSLAWIEWLFAFPKRLFCSLFVLALGFAPQKRRINGPGCSTVYYGSSLRCVFAEGTPGMKQRCSRANKPTLCRGGGLLRGSCGGGGAGRGCGFKNRGARLVFTQILFVEPRHFLFPVCRHPPSPHTHTHTHTHTRTLTPPPPGPFPAPHLPTARCHVER